MRSETSIAFFDYLGNRAMPPAPMEMVFRRFGIHFVESNSSSIPSHSISIRHTAANLRQIQACNIPRERRTLAVLEARVNEPFPFSRRAAQTYGQIVFASHYDTQERELFGWPWTPPQLNLEVNRCHRIAMVNANKFSSAHGEQYSLRRAILREIVAQQLPVDLYGSDWTQSKTRNLAQALRHDVVHLRDQARLRHRLRFSQSRYQSLDTQSFPSLGEIDDKFQTLSHYRFSLVVENDRTFFTEKLMDSLACGCTTFYLGPRLAAVDDLPGVVLLPESPASSVTFMRRYLSTPEATINEPGVIRNAAITTFAQTAGGAWENLAKQWLKFYRQTKNYLGT